MACDIARAVELCNLNTEECQVPELQPIYGPEAIERALTAMHQDFAENTLIAEMAGSSWDDCPDRALFDWSN